MYKITKGNKIRNVEIEPGVIKILNTGDILPENYKVPESYITNKIVEKIEKSTKKEGDK